MSTKYPKPSKSELIAKMNEGLDHFLAFINQFSEAQLLELKDAVGWNGRDHITHLAAWVEGIGALLRREDRWAAMGLAGQILSNGQSDYDAMNAQIADQQSHLSPAEAREGLIAAHERTVAAVDQLDEADLLLPYGRFVAPFTEDSGKPVWNYVAGNSFGHYNQHTPWIKAIVNQ
ncbi:ClbS/DfsB family four-helix bundle protein [Candidatus Leptofilum sp.]|uniref:ClbS/DfsB family four-helix bundle protein n=1 Tax=Candidatus Leptofilum sp. TaxID=3241576 RepID=UPI003B5B2A04